MTSRSKTDRRRFLKAVGLAGLSSALVGPGLTGAQTPIPAKPDTAAQPDSAAADTARAAGPPPIGEDARALAGIVERRYGKDLTREQLESIARDFDGDIRGAKRMREVKLGNADEPDFTFEA